MKHALIAFLLLAATGSTATAAPGFDRWLDSIDQRGWRLVAVSEPLGQALLLGPMKRQSDGADLTFVRYEFMDGGPLHSIVATDQINCKSGDMTRLSVTGYVDNNLKGASKTEAAGGATVRPVKSEFASEEFQYACGMARVVAIRSVAESSTGDPEAVVCETSIKLGSLVPVRTCISRREAEARRNSGRDWLEQEQRWSHRPWY